MTQIQTKFKQTEIGLIPEDWEVVELGEVSDINTGFPFKGEKYSSDGIRVLRGENVSLGFLRWDNDKRWNSETIGLEKYFLQENDVVIGMDGSRVGKNKSIVKKTDLPLLLAQRVARLRGNKYLNQGFLRYLIISDIFEKYVEKIKTGTSIPHISGGQISSFEIPLPPLPEQKAIAEILSSLDDKIELLEKQNKTLENIGQALFKSWFVDFEPFQNDLIESEMRMIPKGWKVGKVGDLDIFVTDYVANGSFATLKANVSQIYEQKNFALFVRNSDLKNNFSTKRWIDEKAYSFLSKTKLFGGELIISNVADVGSVYLCPKFKTPMSLGNNIIMIKSDFYQEFLYFLFKSDKGQALISSITSGSAQLKFNKTDFKNLNIVIPEKLELEKFSKITKLNIEKIENNNLQIQTLSNLRDSLLPRLMSGKIRTKI